MPYREADNSTNASSGDSGMPQPDTAAAIKFLQRYRPTGVLTLSAIEPDGPIETKFWQIDAPTVWGWIARWIDGWQGKRNLYFIANEARPMNKKPAKTDMTRIWAYYTDADPDTSEGYAAGRARLMDERLARFIGGDLPASVVIDSGNGLQALWQSDEPTTTDIDQFEAINKPFSELMGSEGTFNVDRLLRIPGTINLPNKAKLKKGYPAEPSLAVLLHYGDDRYTTDQIKFWTEKTQASAAERARAEAEAKRQQQQDNQLAGLPEALRTRFATHLKADLILGRRWRGDTTGLNDTTRSGVDMSLGAQLKKRGYSYDEMVAILQIFPHGAGAEKDDRYFARIWGNSGQQAGTSSSSDKQSKASAREDEAWPDPGSLAPPVPPAPRFPMAALPHAITAFVADEADRMQAPPDLLAIPALIMLAGCIGKDAVIRPKRHDDWAERACLWGMIIQPPGSMKSAAIAKATAALRHIEAGWRKEDKQKHAEWSDLKADADFRLKAYEKDFAQAMKTGGYDGTPPPKPRAVDDLPEEPKPRRLVAQDVTAEKLGELMVDSRGLTLVRDELSGWVLNMSRYNAGSDRQFYLEAYSGGPGVVDRIRRGELYIPDVYVNIVGGIQPSVAKKLFSVQDGSDDGFLDRFGLIAFPDLPDEWQLVDCWPETGLRQAVNAIADKLAAADWAVTLHTDADVEAGKAKPYVRFSPAAQEIFNDWLTEHMRGMKAAADTPIIGFYSKARGLLGRLTLVIHLTAWAAGDEGDPRTVSEQSLTRALAILEGYLVPMWRRVMAAFSKAPVVDGAHKIGEYIRKKGLDGIRVADISKLDWSGLNDRAAIEAALRTLVDRDWLAEPETVSGARGGRPSATYIVNPKVHLPSGGDHG
jgi:hypothetical protein